MLYEKVDFLRCNVFIGMTIDVQHYASQVGGDDEGTSLKYAAYILMVDPC
jgi:hypothetical protein